MEKLTSGETTVDQAIDEYKNLIQSLPDVNRYLLLYVLDLLSVFARHSEINLMTIPSGLFLLLLRVVILILLCRLGAYIPTGHHFASDTCHAASRARIVSASFGVLDRTSKTFC